MKKILFLLTIATFTSCGIIAQNAIYDNINNNQPSSAGETSSSYDEDLTYLSVEIFQTLSQTEALAWTKDYKVVKLVTESEILYDGKKVKGEHRLIDTYTYATKGESIKTVPVYSRINKIPDEHGKETFLYVEIIQTLSKQEALARTNDYKYVKLETACELYYDGKDISGNFCLAGTYSYPNKDGEIKTVPVYIRTDEYREMVSK